MKLKTAKLKKENEYADGDDRYPFVYGALTGVRQSETYVKAIPAADVAPVVHGEWIDRDGKTWCSRCDASNKQYKPPYCPHCGAKMDGGVNHGERI